MEAAVRAFEDWEFRVLEQESGIDDEDESAAEEKEGGREMEKEISCQQHVVNATQVNNMSWREFSQEFHSCMTGCTGPQLICVSCASCRRPAWD